WLGQAELHERDQALASREHLAFPAGARQKPNSVGDISRNCVLGGRRNHVCLPLWPPRQSGLPRPTDLPECTPHTPERRPRMPALFSNVCSATLSPHVLAPSSPLNAPGRPPAPRRP